jgi:hypothetical protein
MKTKETYQKGDKIEIKSMTGLKKGFGLKIGSTGEVVEPKFDAFNNGGFLLDGITPTDNIVVKLDCNNYRTIIPKKNIRKVLN